MNEKLLQFIWQFQYFSTNGMRTAAGELLQVIFPGHHNANQGPDFGNARIIIGQTTWIGSVELHLKTSDWDKHRHEGDPNYQNVILHVVWGNDIAINPLPVFELNDRVSKLLLGRYDQLMASLTFIPCEKQIATFPDISWQSWKDRLLAERMARKAETIEAILTGNSYHWEETLWIILARNFGMKVNADSFEFIVRSLPLSILGRHRHSVHQLEALLLGQAGFLDSSNGDGYAKMLATEYSFLRNKYNLQRAHSSPLFLRMRPGNFPTLRLAQLAKLIHQADRFFSLIKDENSLAIVMESFNVHLDGYWNTHYKLETVSLATNKSIGKSMSQHLLINCIVPLLYTYGKYYHEDRHLEKALRWLDETPPEKNSITKNFEQLNVKGKSACDSQALIELKNEYCFKKKCLDCSIGNFLIRAVGKES